MQWKLKFENKFETPANKKSCVILWENMKLTKGTLCFYPYLQNRNLLFMKFFMKTSITFFAKTHGKIKQFYNFYY